MATNESSCAAHWKHSFAPMSLKFQYANLPSVVRAPSPICEPCPFDHVRGSTYPKLLTCCSGVLVLQQHYWQQAKFISTPDAKEKIFPETQSAIDTLDRISRSLQHGGHDALQELGDARCTVLFVDLVYQALLVLLTIGVGQPVMEIENKKESLKWLLSHLCDRWALAGKSLSQEQRRV